MSQLKRALSIVCYLQNNQSATFSDLLEALSPVARTTLSTILKELVAEGEIEHVGRSYLSAQGSFASHEIEAYRLPERIRQKTQKILSHAGTETQHACAIFARVGRTTMKIVDQYKPAESDWDFSQIGYEWPLVPFHGFAKVFLAHSEEAVVHDCFCRWKSHLLPELAPDTWQDFREQLQRVKDSGYALEYKEERQTILRLAVPVVESQRKEIRFSVGFVARSAYLLEIEKYVAVLERAALELSETLKEL